MPLRPTLQDVARAAGVGKTTVSLALRNNPKIPEATRRRVQEAAQRLDYRPDPALARIAAYRWRTREVTSGETIAYITMRHPWGAGESHAASRKGATEQAAEFGYTLEVFRLEDYRDPENLGRVLYHRGIRGVLVGQVFHEDFCDRFPWEHFSAVACNIGYFRPPVHLVVPDLAHAIQRAWDEAVAAGYRRIGVALLEEPGAVDLFDKLSAVLYCQSRLPRGVARIPAECFPLEGGPQVRRWLERHRPEVVLGFNDTVFWWLQQAGLAVPDHVAFVSLDMENADRPPHAAGLVHNYPLLGRTAFELLDIQIRTNQVGRPSHPFHLAVESIWHPDRTLPTRDAVRAGGRG